WTWMDEGLNTFVQYLTEQEWDRNYPSRRGPARNIVDYMGGDKSKISPIMTNSESIYQFGNNAYGKPATALNILRESVMGRELFDHAFKEYCRRWAFKRPEPADLFRTMEDASSVDLDWYWRGWFYSTDHVDMNLQSVKWFQLNSQNPESEAEFRKEQDKQTPMDISHERNLKDIPKTRLENDPSIDDFYTQQDPYEVSKLDKEEYQELMGTLGDEEKELLNKGLNFYEVTVENIGGLVMPLIFELEYQDGTRETRVIPVEIWKRSTPTVTKLFMTEKPVVRISLDPFLETADCDVSNNYWPPAPQPTRFDLFKSRKNSGENPMQRAKRNAE
ncbi:MAG: M1 family aminopeptidase, partial [Flavobacteriales bacterium]